MAQTFAEYLINGILPHGMRVERQIDKNEFMKMLTEVGKRWPEDYDSVVTRMRQLGDKLATYDPVTVGVSEVKAPNREKRDEIIRRYQAELPKISSPVERIQLLGRLQGELAKNDLEGSTDDLTIMLRSAMGGKKTSAMKMRTSPGVVLGGKGEIVEEIFPKSYAEGVAPLHFFLNAAESRKNLAEGQVNTAKPGELNKVISNIANSAVVAEHDCGTHQGILLNCSDGSVLGRYLARDVPSAGARRDDLIDSDLQQKLVDCGAGMVLVRSPQTCGSRDGTICQMCLGLRPSTGKLYDIGENAGLVTAGNIGEPLTQMVLSSKHAAATARVKNFAEGEAGFRQIIEMPKVYQHRKIYCEVEGKVERVTRAPQGGWYVIIRQTKMVPERYIELGVKDKAYPGCRVYYIASDVRPLEEVEPGLEVHPGTALSTGLDNLKDVARLRNLGALRTSAAQNMYDVYRNTNQNMDRRHFELLARAMHPYLRIHSAPAGAPFVPGEVVPYQKVVDAVKTMQKRDVPLDQALGDVLGEGVLDLTVGTEIDSQSQRYLRENGVKMVKTVVGLEVSPETTMASRVVNRKDDWLAGMNHRFLKDNLVQAASQLKKSDIHGYNPVTAYAYGSEFGKGEGARY